MPSVSSTSVVPAVSMSSVNPVVSPLLTEAGVALITESNEVIFLD